MKALTILSLFAAFTLQAATPLSPETKIGGFSLGCQAYSFNKFTLFEAIDRTKATGAKTIELFTWQKFSREFPDLEVNQTLPDDKIELLKNKLKAAGLRATSAYIGNNAFTQKDPEKAARQVFEWAKKLDLLALTGEPPESSFDLVEKLCKEYDIKFCLHGHRHDPKRPEYKNWDPSYTIKLMEHRDPRMGFCLDTGHFVRSGGDPIAAIKIFGKRLHTLHLKDPLSTTGDDTVFGGGIGNVSGVLAELRKQKFQGWISIEYENPIANAVPDIRECVDYVRDAAKP